MCLQKRMAGNDDENPMSAMSRTELEEHQELELVAILTTFQVARDTGASL